MVSDLYSKRRKLAAGETPDVFQYESFPQPFRVQVVHIWADALGSTSSTNAKTKEIYKYIYETLCREYGKLNLSGTTVYLGHGGGLVDFFLATPDADSVLDTIELSFRVIDTFCRKLEFTSSVNAKMKPTAAIDELNARFREHGIGYQYESMQLLRVDSSIIHTEVVMPALQLLTAAEYAGPNAEFLAAHEHYRHARYKEALVEALKALESTLKIICGKRGWSYDPNATAKKLLEIVFANGLVPPFLQAQFSSLRSLLESGIPTVRNKLAGHGQGAQAVTVPQHIAAFGIHLASSAILFVSAAERELP
jgi:hypothetical protein